MTKFSLEQSLQIDQAVKETIVKRWTYLEALDYIKATLGYSINAKTYFTKKAKLKKDAASWLIYHFQCCSGSSWLSSLCRNACAIFLTRAKVGPLELEISQEPKRATPTLSLSTGPV